MNLCKHLWLLKSFRIFKDDLLLFVLMKSTKHTENKNFRKGKFYKAKRGSACIIRSLTIFEIAWNTTACNCTLYRKSGRKLKISWITRRKYRGGPPCEHELSFHHNGHYQEYYILDFCTRCLRVLRHLHSRIWSFWLKTIYVMPSSSRKCAMNPYNTPAMNRITNCMASTGSTKFMRILLGTKRSCFLNYEVVCLHRAFTVINDVNGIWQTTRATYLLSIKHVSYISTFKTMKRVTFFGWIHLL